MYSPVKSEYEHHLGGAVHFTHSLKAPGGFNPWKLYSVLIPTTLLASQTELHE
jgi:hypothetical protein